MKSPLKKRGPRFAKAFTTILRDARISPAAKTLLFLLRSYADAHGRCFPSVQTLAASLGAHRTSVHSWLEELESWRIIRRERQHIGGVFASNIYWLEDDHFALVLSLPPCRKNRPRPVSQKPTTK